MKLEVRIPLDVDGELTLQEADAIAQFMAIALERKGIKGVGRVGQPKLVFDFEPEKKEQG